MNVEFGNANHMVNRKGISKVASAYDALAVPNRATPPQLNVTSLSAEDNEGLRGFIAKEAQLLEGSEKLAFLSGGVDLFTRAKGLLGNKVGLPEERANELASPIVVKTSEIQNQYGGDPHKIMDRIIDEMQNQLIGPNTGGQPLPGEIQQSMALTKTPSIEMEIKARLIKELGVTNFESNPLAKSVMSEARDMVTSIRPCKIDQIANAIVDVMVEHRDPSVVYGIKANKIYLAEVKERLGC